MTNCYTVNIHGVQSVLQPVAATDRCNNVLAMWGFVDFAEIENVLERNIF